jgi:hypothetical protein
VSRGRIHRTPDGEILLRLPDEEQLLLRGLAASTRMLLEDGDDPALRRLSPPAYDDEELDREYRELVGRQLADGRSRALELVEETVAHDVLSVEEADAWLRALNDVRLVLGTRLDVTEDLDWDAVEPGDPRLPELALYTYVSWIQEQLVAAAA